MSIEEVEVRQSSPIPARTFQSLTLNAQDVTDVNHVHGALRTKSIVCMASNNPACEFLLPLTYQSLTDDLRTQGKSDQILETVLRMDNLLRSIHENLVWAS